MKRKEVAVGRTYMAKVSGRIVPVTLIAESPYGGWNGVIEETGRAVHVRSAARLRWEVKAAAGEAAR